jgi:hypothetical protein
MLMNKNFLKFYSDSGMSSAIWGKACWTFLFCSVMGRYPVKIDNTNLLHLKIQKDFKTLLCSLSNIMPCVFCRDSFVIFLKNFPIDKYLIGRIELMYWLYIIKDQVNKKLITQERIIYNHKKIKINNLYNTGIITQKQKIHLKKKCKKQTFSTIKSPSFIQVLNFYEKYRAKCSNRTKTCSLPRNKKLK